MRITIKDLKSLVRRLNKLTDHNLDPYDYIDNELVINVGTYLLGQACGGCKLAQMCEGGGGKDITSGFVSKKELYALINMYIKGIEVVKEDK